MPRLPIAIKSLELNAFRSWNGWFLLTAGDFSTGRFNTMTVSWGALGIMWEKPIAQVVVRPTRYTYEFMETYPDFTLSAFPRQYRKALALLGERSGRDGDKIGASGLTPTASKVVAAPTFAEAELVLECRKVYFDDYNPAHFLADYIAPEYNLDYHRKYQGEILAVEGTADYQARP